MRTLLARSRLLKVWTRLRHRQPFKEPPPRNDREQVFWPRDFLAGDVPNARILTYGYHSEVTRGYASASKSGIFALARNLLYKLQRERDVGRPIIFVAHSLGGIITKEVGTLVQIHGSLNNPSPRAGYQTFRKLGRAGNSRHCQVHESYYLLWHPSPG